MIYDLLCKGGHIHRQREKRGESTKTLQQIIKYSALVP